MNGGKGDEKNKCVSYIHGDDFNSDWRGDIRANADSFCQRTQFNNRHRNNSAAVKQNFCGQGGMERANRQSLSQSA